MATVAKTVYPHITKDPGVCSGRPCIEGTRVRVVDILALHEAGHVPYALVEALRKAGWLVYRVEDEPELGKGTLDDRVFAYTAEQGCV